MLIVAFLCVFGKCPGGKSDFSAKMLRFGLKGRGGGEWGECYLSVLGH